MICEVPVNPAPPTIPIYNLLLHVKHPVRLRIVVQLELCIYELVIKVGQNLGNLVHFLGMNFNSFAALMVSKLLTQ